MNSDSGSDDSRITYFAATHTRGKREMFGIRAIDRGKHIYVIGKTGMGKSTMLENMAIQDIQNGEGIAFIDPHGSTAEKLLNFVPYERIKDVIYFAPFDTDHPVGFNVMEDVGYDKRHLVVSGLMGALKRIWVDAWSARMEYILQNTLLALLEFPGSTLLDVNRMLVKGTKDRPNRFQDEVIANISDPIVKSFWTEEYAAFTDTYTREATPAIQNKIGQFTANPLVRNIIGQPHSSFDLRKAMDEKKIFIVNLSKGRMGETNASLLGSMLTVKIYLAAMSRADEPPARMARLPYCYFYVDEFQSMMNEAFADILSESRKYKLSLTLANQYIEQMEEEVRDAVFGNVGTLITFRVGPFDAEVLETVFEPTFTPEDLVGLGIGQIYLTLMIDGVGSKPFSAETIPPIEPPSISYREDVIVHSREKYSRPRSQVEGVIYKKQQDYATPPRPERRRDDFPRSASSGSLSARSGGTFTSTPRENRDAVRPYEGHSPRPVHSGAVPSRPHPEAVERNALRDAIAAAAPAPTQKSPADILRERLSGRGAAPVRSTPTPRPVLPHRPPVAERNPPTPPAPPNPPALPRQEVRPEGEKREAPKGNGEVSRDTLLRVINGGNEGE